MSQFSIFVTDSLPCVWVWQVQAVLAGGSGLEVLSQRFNISIKRADIRTLGGLNWLNDEVEHSPLAGTVSVIFCRSLTST